MTDYKHFPRIPRDRTCTRIDRICLTLLLVFILAALSMAGKEDMKAQLVIDRQEIKEHVQRVVDKQETDARNYFTEPRP